jgi:hypothetical protein
MPLPYQHLTWEVKHPPNVDYDDGQTAFVRQANIYVDSPTHMFAGPSSWHPPWHQAIDTDAHPDSWAAGQVMFPNEWPWRNGDGGLDGWGVMSEWRYAQQYDQNGAMYQGCWSNGARPWQAGDGTAYSVSYFFAPMTPVAFQVNKPPTAAGVPLVLTLQTMSDFHATSIWYTAGGMTLFNLSLGVWHSLLVHVRWGLEAQSWWTQSIRKAPNYLATGAPPIGMVEVWLDNDILNAPSSPTVSVPNVSTLRTGYPRMWIGNNMPAGTTDTTWYTQRSIWITEGNLYHPNGPSSAHNNSGTVRYFKRAWSWGDDALGAINAQPIVNPQTDLSTHAVYVSECSRLSYVAGPSYGNSTATLMADPGGYPIPGGGGGGPPPPTIPDADALASGRVRKGRGTGLTSIAVCDPDNVQGILLSQVPALATFQEFQLYCGNGDPGTASNKICIYTDNSHSPASLVGSTQEFTIAAAAADSWVHVIPNVPIVNPALQDLWCCWHQGGANMDVAVTSVTGGEARGAAAYVSANPPPATFPVPTNIFNLEFGLVADYTLTGGLPGPAPGRTRYGKSTYVSQTACNPNALRAYSIGVVPANTLIKQFYFYAGTPSADAMFRPGLWIDAGGVPGVCLGMFEEVTIHQGDPLSWRGVTTSQTVRTGPAPTTLWLGWWHGGGQLTVGQNPAGGPTQFASPVPYASTGLPPDPFSPTSSFASDWAIVVDTEPYTPPPPPVTQRRIFVVTQG